MSGITSVDADALTLSALMRTLKAGPDPLDILNSGRFLETPDPQAS